MRWPGVFVGSISVNSSSAQAPWCAWPRWWNSAALPPRMSFPPTSHTVAPGSSAGSSPPGTSPVSCRAAKWDEEEQTWTVAAGWWMVRSADLWFVCYLAAEHWYRQFHLLGETYPIERPLTCWGRRAQCGWCRGWGGCCSLVLLLPCPRWTTVQWQSGGTAAWCRGCWVGTSGPAGWCTPAGMCCACAPERSPVGNDSPRASQSNASLRRPGDVG